MTKLGLGYLIKQVQSAYRNRLDAALAEQGLSAAGYAALYHLDREGPMHKSALADACWVTPQTMQRTAAALERARFVRRLKGPGRAIELALTEAGRDAFEAASRAVELIEQQMSAPLTEDEARALTFALKRCRNALV